MGKGIKKTSENQWILGSKTKKVREKVVAEICVVLGFVFSPLWNGFWVGLGRS